MEEIKTKLNYLISKAFKEDEVPVGAVVVYENKIVEEAYNNKEKTFDVTGHAEICCIRKIANKNQNWNLTGYEMYVSLEPCLMCLMAIEESRIKKIYYFNENSKSGGVEKYKKISNKLKIIKLENDLEYERILKKFFKNKRD